MEPNKISECIYEQGMLPLFYHDEKEVSIEIAKALYRAGVRVIEYTNRGEAALENFMAMIRVRNETMPDLLLGIGTIKNVEQAEDYLAAKADFIICPVTIPAVAKVVHDAGKLWIPGCMTVTDIAVAEDCGAKFVKLFPGNILGPAFVSSVKDIFPGMRFMPTGGVDATRESIASWYNAGVSAVGMGSKLLSVALLAAKDYAAIEENTRKVLELVNDIK